MRRIVVSGLASQEALDWKNAQGKRSLQLVFDLVAKRVDEILYDSSMKSQIIQELWDIKLRSEEIIDNYGVKN